MIKKDASPTALTLSQSLGSPVCSVHLENLPEPLGGPVQCICSTVRSPTSLQEGAAFILLNKPV